MSPSETHAITSLSRWGIAIDRALYAGRPEVALRAARVVLKHLPQHLPTYARVLNVAWSMKEWQAGSQWAQRLLRADPTNPLAWRALARAAEEVEQRQQAHAAWQRAFESAPYAPEIRAGLSRTALNRPDSLTLNEFCLAALYFQGRRWHRAAQVYATLVETNQERIDLQLYWLVTLWQHGARADACKLARFLIERREPSLIFAWVVLAELGDENDRALAQQPLRTLDADGEYVRNCLGIDYQQYPVDLPVSLEEGILLGMLLDEEDE